MYLFVLEKVSEKEVLVFVKYKYIIVFFVKIVKYLLVEKRENIINILWYIFLKLKKFEDKFFVVDDGDLKKNDGMFIFCEYWSFFFICFF